MATVILVSEINIACDTQINDVWYFQKARLHLIGTQNMINLVNDLNHMQLALGRLKRYLT